MKPRAAWQAVLNVALTLGVAVYCWSTIIPRLWPTSADRETPRASTPEGLWGRLVADGSRLGPVGATVRVVEFVDYECEWCSTVAPIVQRHIERGRDAAIIVRHFPLAPHGAAEGAARAAICAEAQERFPLVHARLFERGDWRNDQDWLRLATEIGLPDVVGFERCLESPETRKRIEWDRSLRRPAQPGAGADPRTSRSERRPRCTPPRSAIHADLERTWLCT
jgi:hypothetical protein